MPEELPTCSASALTDWPNPSICIMGVDPGLVVTGFGIISLNKKGNLQHCGSGVISPPIHWTFSQRLREIYRGLTEQIQQYKPAYMAVERPFLAKNVRTALLLGEARGMAILAAAESMVEVFELSPLEVKQAVVGYGRAAKEQVQEMVCTLLNIPSGLKADAADALATAVCLAHTLSYKKLLRELIPQNALRVANRSAGTLRKGLQGKG